MHIVSMKKCGGKRADWTESDREMGAGVRGSTTPVSKMRSAPWKEVVIESRRQKLGRARH